MLALIQLFVGIVCLCQLAYFAGYMLFIQQAAIVHYDVKYSRFAKEIYWVMLVLLFSTLFTVFGGLLFPMVPEASILNFGLFLYSVQSLMQWIVLLFIGIFWLAMMPPFLRKFPSKTGNFFETLGDTLWIEAMPGFIRRNGIAKVLLYGIMTVTFVPMVLYLTYAIPLAVARNHGYIS